MPFDLAQLNAFVAVADEGTITKASRVLHLSQPAVSAQVKALESELGMRVFERTARGMKLTEHGERMLRLARRALQARQELLEEARRIHLSLSGRLVVGVDANSNVEPLLGRLMRVFAKRHPDVEVLFRQEDARGVATGILDGRFDAGLLNRFGTLDHELNAVQVADFGLCLVGPAGRHTKPPEWSALAASPWICPPPDSYCGRVAAGLFETHGFEPAQIIRVDRERVTRALVTEGVGVGLLHTYTAEPAASQGELDILWEAEPRVRVVFAHLAARDGESLLQAARSAVEPS
ncbi:MAG: LysR family transcriptional regulator [Myxococcota bacterium]